MLKAKRKDIDKIDYNNDLQDYRDAIAQALNNIGKDNLITVNDYGYMATIWYWEEEML